MELCFLISVGTLYNNNIMYISKMLLFIFLYSVNNILLTSIQYYKYTKFSMINIEKINMI